MITIMIIIICQIGQIVGDILLFCKILCAFLDISEFLESLFVIHFNKIIIIIS